MKIVQISSHDYKGGAARIAWYLHKGYQQAGHQSFMAVGKKSLLDDQIIEIDHTVGRMPPVVGKLIKGKNLILGYENFHFPATRKIPELVPAPPDILHAHNLHGKYFDLRQLPRLSRQFPTMLTLHDTWLLSGHCAYFIDCDRWRTGCGNCPDLQRPPAIRRDASRSNWNRKRDIFSQMKVYLATPSQWLLDQVNASILLPAIIKSGVIYNGVDQEIFTPADKAQVRLELGLPEDAFIFLYVVSSRMRVNEYKDFDTIEKALEILGSKLPAEKKVVFLGLGTDGQTIAHNGLEKRFVPYEKDIRRVAKYYQSADIYLHAANADTFPNVILEALACGTPVIATAVGGISEQVLDNKTGILVPRKGFAEMALAMEKLISNPDLNKAMSAQAVRDARKRFSLERMVADYLDFYQEMVTDWPEQEAKQKVN